MNASLPQPYEIITQTHDLQPTGAVFWTACNGHASDPSRRPCPRVGGTYLYSPRPVFMNEHGICFEMAGTYYRIPDGEKSHVQLNEQKGTTMTKKTTIEQPKLNNFPTSFDEPATAPAPAAAPKAKKAKAPKVEKTNEPKPHRPIGAGIIKFAADGLKGQEWINETIRIQTAAVDACREMFEDEPAFEQATSLYKRLKAEATGKKQGALNQDQTQIDDLCIVARDLGWTNPEFVTEAQAGELGGTIKDGVYRHMMWFTIGTAIRRYYVVNVDDIEWPNGEIPTSIPDKPKTEKKVTTRKGKSTRRAPKGAAPALIHIKLANGIEFDARDVDEARELTALFS